MKKKIAYVSSHLDKMKVAITDQLLEIGNDPRITDPLIDSLLEPVNIVLAANAASADVGRASVAEGGGREEEDGVARTARTARTVGEETATDLTAVSGVGDASLLAKPTDTLTDSANEPINIPWVGDTSVDIATDISNR